MILTARLRLIPAIPDLARAELADRAAFATLLQAGIPDNWPPPMLSDALSWFLSQLEANPDHAGWLSWYGVLIEPSVLVASGGFKGPPRDGAVEVGYSVLTQFQRRAWRRRWLPHWSSGRSLIQTSPASWQR